MRRFFVRFGVHFVYGLLTLLPLIVVIGFLAWLGYEINALFGTDSSIGHLLSVIAEKLHFSHLATLAISYLFALCLIALFGFVVKRYASLHFKEKTRHMMEHFPVLNTIYNTVEQIVRFLRKKDTQLVGSFGEVVFIKFANAISLGLLASRQACLIDGIPHVMVFFPASPIPATGSNYLVPVEDIFLCNLKFEHLSQIIFSLGALAPSVLCQDLELKRLSEVNAETNKNGAS